MELAISLDEVLEQGAFNREIPRSWERSLESLQHRRDQLRGVAVASEEQIEAYVLYWEPGPRSRREILSLAHADTAQGATLLEVLLRLVSTSTEIDVVLPKVSAEEVAPALLHRVGFQRQREYVVWESSAESDSLQ